MKLYPFQAGGPLPADSLTYITRKADEEATISLQRMEYITLIEPREHGKTSLIGRLKAQISPQGYTFAIRDLMAARSSAHSLNNWYSSLGRWLLNQIPFISSGQQPLLPVDSASWEEFLAEIAQKAATVDQKVVIVLDEIGAMPGDWATDFFSIIRSIYTSRYSFSYWQYLTFIIAGAFNPKDLIRDTNISNFNVDHRIVLNDFTLLQTKQLASHLELPPEMCAEVAACIYDWAAGQPYLTQRLCLNLSKREPLTRANAIHDTIDAIVEQFFQEDTHHLERVKNLEPDILRYVHSLTQSQQIRFSAGLNNKHFRLAHIVGVIKPSSQGMCQIRNRIYERAVTEIAEATATQDSEDSPSHSKSHIFISYSHKDTKWLEKIVTISKPLIRKKTIKLWSDIQIKPGAEWQKEISDALVSAKIGLLLVTPNFLNSDFIVNHELPPLLEAAKKKGLTILWIAVSASMYKFTEIAVYQCINEPSKPLDSLNSAQLNEALVQICEKIERATNSQELPH